jgi:transposase
MNWNYFIGIDVSKLSVEICILLGKEKVLNKSIENDPKALLKFWKEASKGLIGFKSEHILCCMEHTGIYNTHLLSFFTEKNVAICLENPTHIKLSGGLQRGKTDEVDAERIAVYAYKEKETLKLWTPTREVVKKLKHLSVLRVRLIDAKKMLSVPTKEMNEFDKQAARLISKLCEKTLRQIDKDLKAVEDNIQKIIDEDETLKRLFEIITSVSGIGGVTAVEILITTNEFKNINSAKKYACYSGLAPFEYSSGTSIRGKSRVSHRANKRVKTLLHMAALTAINYNADMNIYYKRKVDEGKNKMLVINAVRNKLVQRIFACVNDNRLYEKNYQYSLA